MSKIQEAIQQMSVEEMQVRLAKYMAADKEWAPKPIAIEVRHRDIKDISGTNIYDVIVLKDDDTEEIIKFDDRYSKLIYIYTLLHPKGYQRRSLNKPEKDFSELACLYRALFLADPKRLIAYTAKDFNHMMSMAVSFVRKAIDKIIGCEELTIGNPRQYCGRTVIPAVYNGLEVIIDSQIQNHI
jgi:hypothetical protein